MSIRLVGDEENALTSNDGALIGTVMVKASEDGYQPRAILYPRRTREI